VSTYIDFKYLIFCGLKLNVRREGTEGEERKGKEREGGVKERGRLVSESVWSV